MMNKPIKQHDAEPSHHQHKPGTASKINTRQLFAGEKEILIEHEEAEYRLRITSNGKLILTK